MPQESFSLDHLNEKWLTEQWLLSSGVIPESAADTLLMYAYSQNGVRKATLTIDRDDDGNGKNPKVTYQIVLDSMAQLKMDGVKKARAMKNGTLKSLALLALAKTGAPISIEATIIHHAKNYLPPAYSVLVEVLDG
jgi:hypothetical protein